MREILFRGKQEDYGEWIYGGLHKWETRQPCVAGDELKPDEIKYMIIVNSFADYNMPRKMQAFEIIPETVGQYTGLTDKNGKKIFEGDIVRVHQFLFDGNKYENEITISIEYMSDCTCFGANIIDGRKIKHYMGYTGEKVVIPLCDLYGLHEESFEVIGNIHDNKMEDFINGN